MPDKGDDLSALLRQHYAGDEKSLDEFILRAYPKLRRIARGYLSRQPAGHTFSPTDLVHEVLSRRDAISGHQWVSPAHLMAALAKMMRWCLVDHARRKGRHKRGAGNLQVTFEEKLGAVPAREGDLLALDDALKQLAASDPRKAHIVELRFFGGLSVEETAEVLAISPATVKRDWAYTKAWLYRELATEDENEAA